MAFTTTKYVFNFKSLEQKMKFRKICLDLGITMNELFQHFVLIGIKEYTKNSITKKTFKENEK